MSRSKKKSKIRSMTTASSEKQDKREANRKLRRVVKQKINNSEEAVLPELREVSDIWNFNKDGKTYDSAMGAKEMRK
ncbi:hypothetical protein AAG747_27855 [Rapidithrix thailandica]|uniref:Uncharacterized protein n=1 Tax=Rapidithrix thailandica TaxID=413964 RepID=A0AAW9S680_9BACT